MSLRQACVVMAAMALLGGCKDEKQDKPQASNPSAAEDASRQYDANERKILMHLARGTLEAVVNETSIPLVDTANLPPDLKADKGCFVTLIKKGELRGCIGYVYPSGPLYKAVMAGAHNAALRDGRFTRVRPDELDEIEIEISVLLTVPRELPFRSPDDLLGKLRPGVDGVVLRAGEKYSSVYLPQVWKQMPDKTQFMNRLACKAGLPEWIWRRGNVTVLTFQAEVFHESEM